MMLGTTNIKKSNVDPFLKPSLLLLAFRLMLLQQTSSHEIFQYVAESIFLQYVLNIQF